MLNINIVSRCTFKGFLWVEDEGLILKIYLWIILKNTKYDILFFVKVEYTSRFICKHDTNTTNKRRKIIKEKLYLSHLQEFYQDSYGTNSLF